MRSSLNAPAFLVIASWMLCVPSTSVGSTIPFTATSAVREDTSPLNISYSSSTHDLRIWNLNAIVMVTLDGVTTAARYFASFDLHATVDATGHATDGSILLKTSGGSTIWDSHKLVDFGYSDTNFRELDFHFIQSDSVGSLLPGINPGSHFGVAVFAMNGYDTATPKWTSNFSGTGAKNDGEGIVAPVPSTSQAGVILLGLTACFMVGRKLLISTTGPTAVH